MARRPLDIEAYNRAAQSNPCFICGIVNATGDHPHHIVYRDDVAIAVLNRFPTVYGYVLVAPVEHRVGVVADFDADQYVALQRVVHRVGRAVSAVVPTERLYVLSLGSNQGNAHVHWHVAPLPPGVPYEQQQFAALMVESTGGYLDLGDDEQAELAERLRAELRDGAPH
jgi:diadenosine tetraphosphate (Ap4A) HIT family hydrolase